MKKCLRLGFFNIIVMFMLSGCAGIKQYVNKRHEEALAGQNANTTSSVLASRVFYGSNKMDHIAGGQLRCLDDDFYCAYGGSNE
jgi:hypothetical protein